MKDAKTKLGKVKPYEYDSSQFKAELKSHLMAEYRKQYGVEEWAEAEKPRGRFNLRFAMVPVMAMFVLVVFIGYEYISQPLTAYAYMKKVEKRYKALENKGAEVHTLHTIGDEQFEVVSRRDIRGNVHVQVVSDGEEIENFVMKDGVLYVKNQDQKEVAENPEIETVAVSFAEEVEAGMIDSKEERIEGLTSVMNSLVLAELSDPRDEWEKILAHKDADLVEQEDGTVKISYEEEVDGEVFVSEHYFRDFAPVRKLRRSKRARTPRARVVNDLVEVEVEDALEIIEYKGFAVLHEDVTPPKEHKVFVDNEKFNATIQTFVDEEVDELVGEFETLYEKEEYFKVWKRPGVVPVVEAPRVEPDLPVEPEVVKENALDHTLPNVGVDMDTDVATDLQHDITLRERKALMRDIYLEEVFIDLLEDTPHDEAIDEPVKEEEVEFIGKDEEVEKSVDDGGGHTDVESSAPSEELSKPVIETHEPLHEEPEEGVAPSVEHGRDSLIDNSIPEPYMAEPIDPIILPDVKLHEDLRKQEENHLHNDGSPSYTELLKKRQSIQDDMFEERVQNRYEKRVEELDIRDRIQPEFEPVDEFKKEG